MDSSKTIVTRTPLRISLIGGGTDMPYFYNRFGGTTVSLAINKYVYVTAKYHNNFQEKYRLNYSETENVNNIKDIKNLRIKEAIKILKISKPLYINTFADIPANTGLGSSSSFTVGLIQALCKLENKNFSKRKIAELAYKIEAKISNNTIGKQDHYIAAFGGVKIIKYNKSRISISDIIKNKEALKYLLSSLLLIWTGQSRLSHKVLEDQKLNLKKNYKKLISLNKLTKKFVNEIKKKKLNIKKIAQIINNTWQIKKNFSKFISNNHIDKIYHEVIYKTPYSYGGKLLGAGNGGFILIIFDKKNKKKYINTLKKYLFMVVSLDNKGTVML
jgi:D-glycero-alpha-D-manno-heptose-7-phosphate kinase